MERDALLASPVCPRHLDDSTVAAVRAFLGRLRDEPPSIDVFVFGSRSRGDHRPDSDVDLAVVFDGMPGDRYGVLRDLSDVAYDVLLETGIRVQPLPLWRAELDQPELFSNPTLIEDIKRDGIRP